MIQPSSPRRVMTIVIVTVIGLPSNLQPAASQTSMLNCPALKFAIRAALDATTTLITDIWTFPDAPASGWQKNPISGVLCDPTRNHSANAQRPAIQSARGNARTTSTTGKEDVPNATVSGLPWSQRSVALFSRVKPGLGVLKSATRIVCSFKIWQHNVLSLLHIILYFLVIRYT